MFGFAVKTVGLAAETVVSMGGLKVMPTSLCRPLCPNQRQRRKPNVDPVEKGNHVKKKDEGDNPDLHFPHRSGFDGHSTSAYFAEHTHLSLSLI
jgi:hypothetical protein